MTTSAEAFTELYSAETGYNLRHWRQGPADNDPHITGEGCACKPERILHAEPDLCGLEACDMAGSCQARTPCEYATNLGAEVNDGLGVAIHPTVPTMRRTSRRKDSHLPASTPTSGGAR